MKLIFKQRLFSWLASYDIFNEMEETVYTVKGQLSWGQYFKILDACAVSAVSTAATPYPSNSATESAWTTFPARLSACLSPASLPRRLQLRKASKLPKLSIHTGLRAI